MRTAGACLAATEGCGGRRVRRGVRGTILVVALPILVAACGSSASSSGTETYPTGPDIAYVSNGSGWVLFNLVRHSVGRAMSPPQVEAVAVAPNGQSAYGIGYGGILPVNLRTGTFGAALSKVSGCQSISMGGSGQTLYVAGCGDSGADFKTIVPVNVKNGEPGTPIAVPGGPSGVFVSPNGRAAYVVTNGGATLTTVNLVTRTLGKVITVPDGVGELAISPDGSMAYATGTTEEAVGGGKQYSFLTPIDLETDLSEAPIMLAHEPYGIAISPDGHTAYVTGGTYPPGAAGPPTPPDVTSINLVTGRVASTYSVHGGASGIFNGTSG